MPKITRAIKAVAKRRPAHVRRVRVVNEAPPGQGFFVFGGPVCRTLDELLSAIRSMSDDQYSYHTVPRGNDFANWVRDVLCRVRLAKEIEKAKSRKEVIKILENE